MSSPRNIAAFLAKPGQPLEISSAALPVAGPTEIVVKNSAIAVNPLDWHMQDSGVFVSEWPAIIGCDVAGVIHEVGSNVKRFEIGDRVIGHAIGLVTGKNKDGAFQLYTTLRADKATILPNSISFTDGVVVPFALEAAICALCLKEPGIAMPGVLTPALGLPYPSLETTASATRKTLVVYGGSSSVGSMTTQVATAAGIDVIAITGSHNFELSKKCGAVQVFDRKDASLVDMIAAAIRGVPANEFVGIFDAISIPSSYETSLAILAEIGYGQLACVHPPPTNAPANVKAGMIFAVNDVATPVWQEYVTPALEAGKLKCLPKPIIVGKGLEYVQTALEKSKAGVSATKLVVEL